MKCLKSNILKKTLGYVLRVVKIPFYIVKYTLMTVYNFFEVNLVIMVYFFTKENGVNYGTVTLKKIRRIRTWTKFKIWYYKHFKVILDFLGQDYLGVIYNRLKKE